MTPRLVALLTDFGLRDPFVGVMRGVIASIARELLVIDLTHAIPPGAIDQGAFWLARSFSYFPPGTVHVAVVDPGVGTARRPLAVQAAGHLFLGPDNGLLAPLLALPNAGARRLDERLGLPSLSRTFHGRDLFAPAAARLAAGLVAFDEVGPLVTDPIAAPWPAPALHADRAEGRVAVVDHFGNLITDLDASLAAPGGAALIAGRRLPLRGTYGEAAPGEALALVGSFGTVEIAVRDGDAARALGVGVGAPVTLVPCPAPPSPLPCAAPMRFAQIFPLIALLSACASAPSRPATDPPGGTPGDPPGGPGGPGGPRAAKPKAGPDLKAEVGALDAGVVKKNFASLSQKVERCQDERRKQNEKLDFLSGDLKIEVWVAEDGSVKAAFLPRSTLGDRALEKCIVDAARSLPWPKPDGGLKGVASNEFQLPMKADREAVPWASDKAESTVARAKSALGSCRSGGKGPADVTLYVDTDGKVISAGASQPDPEKSPSPDCLVDAVKGLKFPSPGGWPAKVTVAIN